MKAAIFRSSGEPLTIEETPKPEPGPGEMVLRVVACGVCHTDLHYTDHNVPTFKKPPIVLGHEISGIVDETGPGVDGWKKGDRVLLPAVVTCGECELCRAGRENICLNMIMWGNHADGGYAEYVKAPAKDAVRIPGSLDLEASCIIADALSTPYHAVANRARVKKGELVAVFGCGGVGINAVQFASAAGARVFAVDKDEEKLELARSFGASEVVVGSEDLPKQLKKMTSGGVDVAIECIGNPDTVRQGLASIRRGGRVCVVGFCDRPAEVNVGRIMFFEQQLIGSLGCRPADYDVIVKMVEAGTIKLSPLVTGRFPLDGVNDALDQLRAGKGFRNIVMP